jgi:hypothetical protein
LSKREMKAESMEVVRRRRVGAWRSASDGAWGSIKIRGSGDS